MKHNRNYFRVAAVVYLRILEKEWKADTSPVRNDFKDSISLELDHFIHQLEYKDSENNLEVKKLAEIVKGMHAYWLNQNQTDTNSLLRRISTTISGSGLSFHSETPFEPEEILKLQIAFPDYPFSSIQATARVIRSDQLEDKNKFKIALSFEDITEEDRDEIIRFVNFIQRKKVGSR